MQESCLKKPCLKRGTSDVFVWQGGGGWGAFSCLAGGTGVLGPFVVGVVPPLPSMFCLHRWFYFMVFPAQKLIYTINVWFPLVSTSFFSRFMRKDDLKTRFKVQNKYSDRMSNLMRLLLTINFCQFCTLYFFS